MMNARPSAAELGSQRNCASGNRPSSAPSSTPQSAPTSIAQRTSTVSAPNPPVSASATAFHVATAGAGHSGVISIACGSGISN